MARLSMAPYERCGDGIVAGREGICWSVVSNALRCQRSSEDASIPGVACRTLNRQHPCPSCASLGSHSKPPPPPGTAPHLNAAHAHASHCDATAACPTAMRRRRESLLSYAGALLRSLLLLSTIPWQRCLADLLMRHRSCLGRRVAAASLCLLPAASGEKQRLPPVAPSAR